MDQTCRVGSDSEKKNKGGERMHLSYKILIGMVLGVIAGLVAGPTSAPLLKVWVTPVGTIFINSSFAVILNAETP